MQPFSRNEPLLEGVKSNHPGIGAGIKVVVKTAAGEQHAIYKTVRRLPEQRAHLTRRGRCFEHAYTYGAHR